MLLFLLLFIAGWPFYQYIFDVDGIGYASVADHYAAGDWQKAVNGYWSPLHSWLILPLIKAGVSTITAFKMSNAVIACLLLLVLDRWLNRYEFSKFVTTGIYLTAVVLLLYYSYYELSADLLMALLLLVYFYLLSSPGFFSNRKKNLLAAFVGAAAYLAKAYAFPFFLLHFSFAHLFLNKERKQFGIYMLSILIFLLCCSPWIIALHAKYGEWMIGTAGKLNMSWHLIPERNDDVLFYPPPFAGAPSWWEDPWYLQKVYYTVFSSSELVKEQFWLTVHNVKVWLIALFELSPVIIPLLGFNLYKAVRLKDKQEQFFSAAFLLLPLGYWFIHFESRFIWSLSFLFLVYGAVFLSGLFKLRKRSVYHQRLNYYLLFISFLVIPLVGLVQMANRQKDLFEMASQLKKKSFSGTFTSNSRAEDCMIIAYLTKTSYYEPSPFKEQELYLADLLKQHGIASYLFFYETEAEKSKFLQSESVKNMISMQEVYPGAILLTYSNSQ